MQEVNRAIVIMLIAIIAVLMIQQKILVTDIHRKQKRINQLAEDNALYVSQMMPIQKIQNGIYCSEIESNQYLLDMWHKHRSYYEN
jgi:Tfp pilus assembly protein PilV